MIDKIARESADSLWREVGEEAVKKAVSTFIGEGIKAVVEIWKDRYMQEWEREREEREKARKADSGDSGDGADGSGGEEDEEPEADLAGYEW